MVSDAELSLDLVDDGVDLCLVAVANGMVINFYPGSLITSDELSKKASIIRSYNKSEIVSIR